MQRLRRAFAWLFILGGGFVIVSLLIAALDNRPITGKPLPLSGLLSGGFMLGVCPIFLGSILLRSPKPWSPTTTKPGSITSTPTAVPIQTLGEPPSSDPDAIHCTVALSQQDLVRFQYWMWRHNIRRVAAMVAIGLTVVVFLNLLQYQGPFSPIPLILTILLVTLTFAFTPYLSGRSQFRRIPALSQTTRYEFSAAGYRCWSSDAASTCGWGTTPQAYESRHAYLLMIQPRIYRIVPKTALAPTDHDRFRRLLADQLGERWRPMPTVSARPTNV